MHFYRSKSTLNQSLKKCFQRILEETVVGCPWSTRKDKRHTKSLFYKVCFEAYISVIKLASTFFAYFNFLLAIHSYLKQTSQNGRSINVTSIKAMEGPEINVQWSSRLCRNSSSSIRLQSFPNQIWFFTDRNAFDHDSQGKTSSTLTRKKWARQKWEDNVSFLFFVWMHA